MKRCFTWYIVRKMQMKRKYHYIPIRMAKVQNTDFPKYEWGCETTVTFICSWWKYKLFYKLVEIQFGKQFGSLLEKETYSYSIIWQPCSLVFTKRVENLCLHGYLHIHVYGSFINNWQNMEATEMSFSR